MKGYIIVTWGHRIRLVKVSDPSTVGENQQRNELWMEVGVAVKRTF